MSPELIDCYTVLKLFYVGLIKQKPEVVFRLSKIMFHHLLIILNERIPFHGFESAHQDRVDLHQ